MLDDDLRPRASVSNELMGTVNHTQFKRLNISDSNVKYTPNTQS